MTEAEIKQRLAILDEIIAGVVFNWHEDGDSASDYVQLMWKAQRLVEPLMKTIEIVAPSAGSISDVEAYDGMNVDEDRVDDTLLSVDGAQIAAGVVGKVEKVLVKGGETVKRGQPLVRIRAYQRPI